MVSSDNQLIGLVAIILGFFVATRNKSSTVESVFRGDTVTPMSETKTQDPQIPALENLLSQATQLFTQTFRQTPFQTQREKLISRVGAFRAKQIIRGSSTINGIRVPPQRGPNVLGLFGATGVQTGIDPFTGTRILTGFGPRASFKTRSFFGDPSSNLMRITEGNIIKGQLSDFIKNIQGQLNILQTNSV